MKLKYIFRRVLPATVGAALFIAAGAMAQETAADTDPVIMLDEIVVTAARVETKLKETPATIDVISGEDVQQIKYRNAADLLSAVPGVFTQNLNGEEELTSIRVPTHFANPYSLLLVDGLPANGFGAGAGGMLREINNSSVASIEIIKGPASALYGSNAIGGVINVITKTPTPEPWVSPWIEYGDYDQWRGGLSGGGSIGPVVMNAEILVIDSQEWREHSAHEKQSATVRALYESGVSLLDFKLEYLNLDNDTGGTLSGEDFAEDWRQSYMTFTNVTMEKWSPSLTYTTGVLGGEAKASVQVRTVDHEVNPNYGIRYNGMTRRFTSYLNRIEARDMDFQFLFTREFSFLKTRMVTGLDVGRGDSEIDTYDLSVTRDSATGKYTDFTVTGLESRYTVDTIVAAPYFQLLMTPFERTRLSLGGRYDAVKYEIEDDLNASPDAEETFSRFTPKIGFTFDPTKQLNLFGSYSRGFVVPTVSQLFTGRGASRELDPEEADNYEVGLRSAFFDKKMTMNVSLYYMEIDDKVIVQTIDPVTSAIEYRNVGKTSHKGIETTLTAKPASFLSLSLSHAYAQSTYEAFDDPVTGIDFSGKRMPLAPEHMLNARLSATPWKTLWLAFEVDYQDKYYVDDGNTDTYNRPTLVNLRGSYKWQNWSLWVHALNVTDETYATRVTYSYGSTSFFPGNPRTLYIGLSYHWGES